MQTSIMGSVFQKKTYGKTYSSSVQIYLTTWVHDILVEQTLYNHSKHIVNEFIS